MLISLFSSPVVSGIGQLASSVPLAAGCTDLSNVQAFLGGVAVTLFVASLQPRKVGRIVLGGLAFLVMLAACFWSELSPHVPKLANSLQDVASNAWVWFALVMGVAVLTNLIPAIETWRSVQKSGATSITSAINSLVERREWAIHNLLNRAVKDDRQLERWTIDFGEWRASVVTILRGCCTQLDVSRFDVIGLFPVLPFSWAYNQEHNWYLMCNS